MSAPTPPTQEGSNTSEPSYTQLQTTDLPWYTEDVEGQLTPEVRHIFETYSAIPPERVIPHVASVRKKLWDIRAYPCTGLFVFLVPWIRYHSALPLIIATLQPSGREKQKDLRKVLDVGMYISHYLRALHFAGIPLSSLYGLDIISFIDLGWELFNDREKFDISDRIVLGDILDFSTDSSAAKCLDGEMDVVWCSAVLHQFTWAQSITACKRLVRFTKGAGSLIVGCQVGGRDGEGELDMHETSKGKAEKGGVEASPFKHNAQSLERMWRCVGEELGVLLEVSATWREWREFGCEEQRCGVMGDDMGVLEWTVKLL